MGDSSPRPPRAARRNHALWIGPVVAFFGVVSYFEVFARFPALRDVPWINVPLVLVGAALSGLALWRTFARRRGIWIKAAGAASLALSTLLGGFLLTYVFVLSYDLPAPTATTLALEQAPDFSLPDSAGRNVSLSDFRGSKVVLVFYRGFW